MTQASRLAEGRYLMLLNNDVMMTAGALQALYAAASDHPNAGVVVPQFIQARPTCDQTRFRVLNEFISFA